MSIEEYTKLFNECGGINVSDFHSPQEYGIGVGGEFCGTWTKQKAPIDEWEKPNKD